MTKTIENPKVEKMAAPAKRWRNKYRTLRKCVCAHSGEKFNAGQVFWGARIWPSKETAEQGASEIKVNGVVQFQHSGAAEYLGAFPVES